MFHVLVGSLIASSHTETKRNGDGDTKMTGIDAILTAIKDLKLSTANVSILGYNTNKRKKNQDNNPVNKQAISSRI